MHGGSTRPVGRQTATRRPPGGSVAAGGALAALPAAGVLVVVAALLVLEPVRSLTETPPVDSLAVERTVLDEGRIELRVRNDGRADVTIAQVLVNDAYWAHTASDRGLARFGAATITVDYPWQEGVPLHLAVLTGSGTVVEHHIDNPSASPDLDRGTAATLGLAGLLVAPIPIAIGLTWLPALRRSPGARLGAALAFTLGLLVFLLVDSTAEGLEAAAQAPQVLDGVGLFAVGALVAAVAVASAATVGRSGRPDRPADGRDRRDGATLGGPAGLPGAIGRRDGQDRGPDGGRAVQRLAWLVAAGIGLHNLGEGLAVGTAVNAGDVALGTALVLGFAAHNVTEGVALAGPLSTAGRAGIARLAGVVAVAGLPVLVGLWLGGFVLPSGWAALAFGVAVGAIAEVAWAVAAWLRDRGVALSPLNAGAFCCAVVLLYITGLATS